jgi:hypothetical protein
MRVAFAFAADITDEMVTPAQADADKAAVINVQSLKGTIDVEGERPRRAAILP